MALIDSQQRRLLRRRQFITGGAAALAATGTVWRRVAWADPSACEGPSDLALVNGHILTMDPSNPVVSAVAIRNGRFSQIGHAEAIGL